MTDEHSFDETDRAIVAALEQNCRLPASAVAKMLGLTPAKVALRIASMLDSNVIKFTAQTNLRAFGYSHTAIVELTLGSHELDNAVTRIWDIDNVIIGAETLGRPHMFLQVVARSLEEMRHVVHRQIGNISGVIESEVSNVIDTLSFAPTVGTFEKNAILWTPAGDDELDNSIIDALKIDARTSNSKIARQLGTSEAVVRQRIKKLSEENRIRFGILTEQRFLTGKAILFRMRVSPTAIRATVNGLKDRMPLMLVTEGRHQVVAALHDIDVSEANRFLFKHIEPLPGVIDVRAQSVVRVFKHNYNCIIVPS